MGQTSDLMQASYQCVVVTMNAEGGAGLQKGLKGE